MAGSFLGMLVGWWGGVRLGCVDDGARVLTAR